VKELELQRDNIMNGDQQPQPPSTPGQQVVPHQQLTTPQQLIEFVQRERNAQRTQYLNAQLQVVDNMRQVSDDMRQVSDNMHQMYEQDSEGLRSVVAALSPPPYAPPSPRLLPPSQLQPVVALPQPPIRDNNSIVGVGGTGPTASAGKQETTTTAPSHINNSAKTGTTPRGTAQAKGGTGVVGGIVGSAMKFGKYLVFGSTEEDPEVAEILRSLHDETSRQSPSETASAEARRQSFSEKKNSADTRRQSFSGKKPNQPSIVFAGKKPSPDTRRQSFSGKKPSAGTHGRSKTDRNPDDDADAYYNGEFLFPDEEIDPPPSDEEHTIPVVRKSSGGDDKKRPTSDAIVPRTPNNGGNKKRQTNGETPTTSARKTSTANGNNIRCGGRNKRSRDEPSENQSAVKRSRKK